MIVLVRACLAARLLPDSGARKEALGHLLVLPKSIPDNHQPSNEISLCNPLTGHNILAYVFLNTVMYKEHVRMQLYQRA